jgi:hypothetical protein
MFTSWFSTRIIEQTLFGSTKLPNRADDEDRRLMPCIPITLRGLPSGAIRTLLQTLDVTPWNHQAAQLSDNVMLSTYLYCYHPSQHVSLCNEATIPQYYPRGSKR